MTSIRYAAAAATIVRQARRLAASATLFATLALPAAAQTPIANAVQVGAGAYMSCILTTGGGVQCWGNNDFGSLGTGSVQDSAYATNVAGLDSGVTAIAVGSYHACALTVAGVVKCWGYNNSGQLGTGNRGTQRSPITVSGLGAAASAILAGDAHTCAITVAGALKCWGANNSGQLGDGTTTGRLVPTAVTGLGSGVAAVAGNRTHTCAVTGAGAVLCWGANASGQLGNGTTTAQLQPTAVTGLGSGVAGIATGDQHTCARLASGALKCWGNNGNGQLGDGTFDRRTAPVDVVGLGGSVVALGAGGSTTCALIAGGAVRCWGDNYVGQVGDGTLTARPTAAGVPAIASGATAIGVGSGHHCAVVGGTVKCWGQDDRQQLGDGATRPRLTPVAVAGAGSGIAAVAAGDRHSCAVTAAGGVRCWGANSSSQLGDASGNLTGTGVTPAGLAAGVSAVAAGSDFNCALTTAGGVKCWGPYGSSETGTGGDNASVPTDVIGLASGVKAISAGQSHACALTAAGGVRCWGANYAGMVGDGTTDERPAPVDVAGLTSGVAAIAAGAAHTCALMTGGIVRCWGYNGSGQLGDGTFDDRLTPVTVAGVPAGVTAVVAGGSHTCVLTAGGSVQCWGANDLGQLGDGTSDPQTAPTAVKGLPAGVTAITAGTNHACAIAGGAARCWGGNPHGELGDGTTVNQHLPVAVTGLPAGASAIDAGATHTCAVVGGGARCWGSNSYGEAGDGVQAIATTPVAALAAPRQVIEFYNTPLDNFFITSDPVEAAAIDSGSAGPGWARTGNVFPSGGDTAVCRFYGSLSPGPNSHFYTASAGECADLTALAATTPATTPRWNFESRDFLTSQPVGGACPALTVPVYRAYNNGFSRHVDSNHRITNNQQAIADVVARGWVSEGLVMCAPQ